MNGDISMARSLVRTLTYRPPPHTTSGPARTGQRSWQAGSAKMPSKKQATKSHKCRKRGRMAAGRSSTPASTLSNRSNSVRSNALLSGLSKYIERTCRQLHRSQQSLALDVPLSTDRPLGHLQVISQRRLPRRIVIEHPLRPDLNHLLRGRPAPWLILHHRHL